MLSLVKADEIPEGAPGATRRVSRTLAGGVAAALVGAALLSAAVKAEDLPFGTPTVPYSGVTVTEVDGATVRSRIYYTPGLQRMEMEMGGTQQIMLIDFDNEISYMLMPQMKSYMVLPHQASPVGSDGTPGLSGGEPLDGSDAQIEHEVLGQETVDGHAATKYRFSVTAPGTSTEGVVWVTAESIILRSESQTRGSESSDGSGKVVISLRDLVIGPQEPSLFELPAGYQKIGVN